MSQEGRERYAMIEAARARRTDPDTSHAAAASVNINKGRAQVLHAFLAIGPMTDDQLVRILARHMSPSGARSRRSELTKMGLIKYANRDVKLDTGRYAMAWELMFGREFYEDLLRTCCTC